MRDLPLNALRAFAVIYQHQGLRAAARELDVAHSSLSRHLAELEKWVGVPLVEGLKGRRRLRLTPAGEALGRAALAAFTDLDRAATSVREVRSPHTVVISTTASFAVRWLLPRLPRLEAAHPRLVVSVLVEQRPVDLETGEVHLAIRMGRSAGKDVDAEPLMDEVLFPVMSPAYWERSGRPARSSALSRLRLLHDRDPHTGWDLWRRAHGPSALDVRAGPRFSSSDLVLRAAEQGQGVALARQRLAAESVANGTLLRPFGDLELQLGPAYWLVFPTHGRSRDSTALVASWLRSEAGPGHSQH